MEFHEKIKKYRKEKKLTQNEVAAMIGVSCRTMINYESGIFLPQKEDTYEKLAKILETTVADLKMNIEDTNLLTEEFITYFQSDKISCEEREELLSRLIDIYHFRCDKK